MGWDDRFIGAFYFFVGGTMLFEPFGFAATIFLSLVAGVIGFLVGGASARPRARREL